MRALALIVVAGVLAAGCGGQRLSERRAIVNAVAHDPENLLYYRAPAWWGRSVATRVEVVRVRGRWAVARVHAFGARPYFATQWVLLWQHVEGGWTVMFDVERRAVEFPCKLAPHGVVVGLVGGCRLGDNYRNFPARITGPTAFRAPTAAERTPIVRATEAAFACAPRSIRVSKLDSSYATVFGHRCGGGSTLVVRQHGRWSAGSGAWALTACREGPPGVMRSLFGTCLIS